MARIHRSAVAGAGSVALLGGALAFQYLGGLYPCQMCIWQRWPHGLAIAAALVALLVPSARRPLAILGGLIVLVGAGIGLFHAGVEQGWWEGVTACASTQDLGALSADELLNQILEAPVVRCDEIPWSLGGLSMAAWNAVLSLVIAVVWLSEGRHRVA